MMKSKRLITLCLLLTGMISHGLQVKAQDPNFYIYLCFGQSNMEGQGIIEAEDRGVDSRFRVMEAVNCSNLGRTIASWYTAEPPLCRCYTGLGPADYFGRTMVKNLPENIKIGIVHVAVAGCRIELFDKDSFENYVAIAEPWKLNIINEYGGNPYGRLVEIARLAQNDGVIKGILLHQGESNVNDYDWPLKVKKIYDDLMTDLELNPDSVPLLAGEVVHADQGGVCASMNAIIADLPGVISNSHVISSSGCTDVADNVHFSSEGYREIGKRYAVKMLSLMGIEADIFEPESIFLEAECGSVGDNWNIISSAEASNKYYVEVNPAMEDLTGPSSGDTGTIVLPFIVADDTIFHLYARFKASPGVQNSFWLRMDGNDFSPFNDLLSQEWQWIYLDSFSLATGEHSMTMAYGGTGGLFDKFCISNVRETPSAFGENAVNNCDPYSFQPVVIEEFWFEAECADVGGDWDILPDLLASNEFCLSIKEGNSSISEPPGDSAGVIYFPFHLENRGRYYLTGRFDCPASDRDSYWLSIDDDPFELWNHLESWGWQWFRFNRYFDLIAGDHTISVAFCEEKAKMDKILISNLSDMPTGSGEVAQNICDPQFTGLPDGTKGAGFNLGQNIPNPFTETTNIPFEVPYESFISLKIYTAQGKEIEELAGKKYPPGIYSIEFFPGDLPAGIYLIKLTAGSLSTNMKIIYLDR